MQNLRFVVWMFSVGVIVLAAGVVSGQAYPNRPIRIGTVGVGGTADFAARQIGQGLTDSWGQPVIVENRPTIAAIEAVAKAPPDGYILAVLGSTTWILPLLQTNVSWDPVRDFSPILLVAESPLVLGVHPSLPVKSLKELLSLAKARPGALNYGSSTVGSASHLAAELFKSMAGINIVGVNYMGNVPATTALISGEVQMSLAVPSLVAPHIKSGKLRGLAVSSLTPSALAPGLPTIAASGLPGYEATSVESLFAPAKTPAAIITRLNQEIVRFLRRSEIKEKFLTVWLEPAPTTPEEFAAKIKSEMSSMGKVIKEAGIKID